MITCEYCLSIFSNEKSMIHHQRKAKYCLQKQNKLYLCNDCNINFNDSIKYNDHISNCPTKLKNIIKKNEDEFKIIIIKYEEELKEIKCKNIILKKELEKKIFENNLLSQQTEKSQEQLYNLSKEAINKPTTTNNNNNNKIINMPVFNIDSNELKNILSANYNINVISEGQKGVAKFAYDFILKDANGVIKYICTDSSRKIFKFKNELGELEKDINAQKLTNILTENGINEITTQISQQFWTKEDGTIDSDKLMSIIGKASEIKSLKTDNTIFKNELATMTSV